VITIIDAVMGSGKTTYVLNEIERRTREDISAGPFLYVSPMLSEVGDPSAKSTANKRGRIGRACPAAGFFQPKDGEGKTKSEDLEYLLAGGDNVACTHKLYELLTPTSLELIRGVGYEVIIDEALGAVSAYETLGTGDEEIIGKLIMINENGLVVWCDEKLKYSRYKDVYEKYQKSSLYLINGKFILIELPPELLRGAKSVTICTYMFESSVMALWLQKNKLEYQYADNLVLGLRDELEILEEAKKLITFVEAPSIQKGSYSNLGMTKRGNLKKIGTNLRGVLRRQFPEAYSSKNYIWTCTQEFEKQLRPDGGKDLWVASNTRATNDYGDKELGVFLKDTYPLVPVKAFFKFYGLELSDDLYALSELIQWTWRLRIRNGQPIILIIGSKRMQTLMERWLNGEFTEVKNSRPNLKLAV
jgi:hypothetical protein